MTALQSFTSRPASAIAVKAVAGHPPANTSQGASQGGLLRRSLSRCVRLLATLMSSWRARPGAAIHPDEAGNATLRDLGLENGRASSPYDLTDIDAGLESTRMRLFVMTGNYWRGS